MSQNKEHGLSVGISNIKNSFFITIKVVGTLKHTDYEIMVPMIESAIQGVKDVDMNVLVDARDFNGWEVQAAWDDLKFGLSHITQFNKLAFVGNKTWEEYAVKISDWFSPSMRLEYFEDIADAREWISLDESTASNVQKELLQRKQNIKEDLEKLFKHHLAITDYDIPKANDQEASEMLVKIFSQGLEKIKENVQNKKYENY